jgi:hypothetical protein
MDEYGSVDRNIDVHVQRFTAASFALFEVKGWEGYKTLHGYGAESVTRHADGVVESGSESFQLAYWSDETRSPHNPFITVTSTRPGSASASAARSALLVVDGQVSQPSPDERETVDRLIDKSVEGKPVSFYVCERQGFFAACGVFDGTGIAVAGHAVDFGQVALGYAGDLDEYITGFRRLMP